MARGVGGDLVAGGHDESRGGVSGFQPVFDALDELGIGAGGSEDVGGDSAGEDQVGSGLFAGLLRGEGEHGGGGGGVDAVHTALGHVAQAASHFAVDVDGEVFSGGVDAAGDFRVIRSGVFVEEGWGVDVAVEVVADEEDFEGSVDESFEDSEVAGVDGVDESADLFRMVEDGHAGFFDAEVAAQEVAEAGVGQLTVDEGEFAEGVLPGFVAVEAGRGGGAVHQVADDVEVVDGFEEVLFDVVGVAGGFEDPLFFEAAERGDDFGVEDAVCVGPRAGGDGVVGEAEVEVAAHFAVGDGVELLVEVDEALIDLPKAAEVEEDVVVFLVPVGQVEHEGNLVGGFALVDGLDTLSWGHGIAFGKMAEAIARGPSVA